MDKFIKKANSNVEYTLDQLRELRRCAADPIYFISNYCYVQHQLLGKVKFELRDYQKRIVTGLKNNRFTCLVIGRQAGKCFSGNTLINIGTKPTGFKKALLKLLFPAQYKKVFYVDDFS